MEFKYDALGRRTEKKYKDTITNFVWDGNTPLHEWVESEHEKAPIGGLGAITWVFDADSFVPSAKLVGEKSYSIVSDYLGTPCQAYDANGGKVWECEQKSYGGVESLQGAVNFIPFRYQGQYEDVETGLYYNRFRYYSPEEGSYISQDPIGLNGGNNLYSYVHDTNAWIDQLGLASNSVYVLKDSTGNVVYVGITDRNPATRMKEHANSGKTFHHMEVLEDGLTRRQARNIEGSILHHKKNSPFQNKRRLDGGFYHSYPKKPKGGRKLLSAKDVDHKLNNGKYSIKHH